MLGKTKMFFPPPAHKGKWFLDTDWICSFSESAWQGKDTLYYPHHLLLSLVNQVKCYSIKRDM